MKKGVKPHKVSPSYLMAKKYYEKGEYDKALAVIPNLAEVEQLEGQILLALILVI